MSTVMGQIIKPMKADLLPDDFVVKNHIIETKLDGHRILVEVDEQNNVHSWSNLGNTSNHKMDDELIKAISNTLLPGVYDGELHLPEPGTSSSDVALLSNRHKLVFTAFDILYEYGTYEPNRMNNSLSFRKDRLEDNWLPDTPRVLVADYRVAKSLNHLWATARNLMAKGYEGVIVKNLDSIYTPGKRSKDWLKIKACETAVLTIIGYEPPATETEYGVILLQGKVKGKEITTSVKVPNLSMRDHFLKSFASIKGDRCVIEYQNITTHGLLRHPRFDRFWDE